MLEYGIHSSYKHDSIDNIACNRGSGLFFTLMSVCSTWPILVMTPSFGDEITNLFGLHVFNYLFWSRYSVLICSKPFKV